MRIKLSLPFLLATSAMAVVAGCGIREHNVQPGLGTDPVDPIGPGDPGDPAGGTGGAGGSSAGAAGGTGGSTAGRGGSNPGGGGTGTGGSAGGRGGTGGGPAPDAASTPPAPPGTINLGGTNVPKEKAIVILHFGHSNMLGHGETPESLRPYFFTPQPRLWAYRGNGSFIPAVEPLSSGGRSRDTAGPGMALLKAAAALAPEDTHFISIGYGIGSATTQDWSKGGLHYSRIVNPALQLRGRVTFGAAFIMLGITDRHMPAADQPGFADRMVKIAADLRADLGVPELPILHTEYEMESTGSLAPTSPVGMRFVPLILMLPERIPRLALIPTNDLGMEDDHHFSMAGHKDWSDRGVKILVDKGWATWTAGP